MTTQISAQATYTALTFNGTEAIKFDATGITDGYGDLSVTPAKLSQKLTSSTAVTFSGQTSIDFTGIPSWVSKIYIPTIAASTSGGSLLQIQLGSSSGGIETSSYVGTVWHHTASAVSAANHTTGFAFDNSGAAGNAMSGIGILTKISGNTWVYSGQFDNSSGGAGFGGGGAGYKTLSSTLDRIRLTTVNGTDTLDVTPSAGSINILYE